MEALSQAQGLLKSAQDQATEMVTGQKPSEPDMMSDLEDQLSGCCPTMSKTQRLYGAISCMALGAVVSFLSTITFWGGKKHLSQFAVLYSVGNVLSMCSSGFIIGPCRQLKVMCMPVRREACCVYLISLVLTRE